MLKDISQIEFQDILDNFVDNNINISGPGFYDDKNFLIIEKQHSNYLEYYAKYVKCNNYSTNYLTTAGKKINLISDFLYHQLKKDGRQGACVDISIALSRFLERERIWNYIVNGCLTIQFPKTLNISTKHFWYYDEENRGISAAHAWVVAPPFEIIDLTLSLQLYKENEQEYLPEYLLSISSENDKLNIEDICAPEFISKYFPHYLSKEDILNNNFLDLKSLNKAFPVVLHNYNNVFLKYTPIGIGAPDQPLENITTLNLNGKSAFEIYSEWKKT